MCKAFCPCLIWSIWSNTHVTPRFLSNFLPIFDLAKSSHSPPPIRKLLLKLLVDQSRSKSTHFHERSFHSLEVFANVWFDLFWFPGSQLTMWPHHPLSSVKLLIKLFVDRDQVVCFLTTFDHIWLKQTHKCIYLVWGANSFHKSQIIFFQKRRWGLLSNFVWLIFFLHSTLHLRLFCLHFASD